MYQILESTHGAKKKKEKKKEKKGTEKIITIIIGIYNVNLKSTGKESCPLTTQFLAYFHSHQGVSTSSVP